MKPIQPPASRTYLDEDFATGVLTRVDLVMAGRRRVREIASALAMACIAVAVTVLSLREVSPLGADPTELRTADVTVALSDDRAVGNQTEALMFPDVAPLARIDNTYFEPDSSEGDILPAYPDSELGE